MKDGTVEDFNNKSARSKEQYEKGEFTIGNGKCSGSIDKYSVPLRSG